MKLYFRHHIPETCWALVATCIIAIVLFAHLPEGSSWSNRLPLNGQRHFVLMAVGVMVLFSIGIIVTLVSRNAPLRKRRLLFISIALTIIQIIITHSYYFHTDWDVQQVTGAAEAMARGESVDGFDWYFQDNPNNVFLARLIALVFFLTGPLWGADVSLFPLICLQCVACWICGLMLFQISLHIGQKKSTAVLAFLFYYVLVASSPWWTIPYSDVWGLLILVVILWTATTAPIRKKPARVILVVALTVVGYYIKPQTVLLGLSLLFFFAIKYRHSILLLRRPMIYLSAAVAIGVVVGWAFVHLATVGSTLHLSSSKSLGMTHYLMLGANQSHLGIYSDADLNFSRSFSDKHARRKAQLNETVRRYKSMGVEGSLILWCHKDLMTFSDGTFFWGHEGLFYKEVPERHSRVADIMRNIYYNCSMEGKYYRPWVASQTAVWFGILLTSALAVVACFKNGIARKSTLQSIMLALILVVLFHTIFECRARYLFCFTPLFVLLSAEGVGGTLSLLKKNTPRGCSAE